MIVIWTILGIFMFFIAYVWLKYRETKKTILEEILKEPEDHKIPDHQDEVLEIIKKDLEGERRDDK